MNKETLEKILSHQDAPSSQDIIELEEMCIAYPFYPLPFIALAQILKNKGNYTYEMMLQKAALRIHDRELLHGYVIDGESIWHQPQAFSPPQVITDISTPPTPDIDITPAVEPITVITETTPTDTTPISTPPTTTAPTPPTPNIDITPAVEPITVKTETTPSETTPVSTPPTTTAPTPPTPNIDITPAEEPITEKTETTPSETTPVSTPPTTTAPTPPTPDIDITPAVEPISLTPSAFPAQQTGSFAFWLQQFSSSSKTSQPTSTDSTHQLPSEPPVEQRPSSTLVTPDENNPSNTPLIPSLSITSEQIPYSELPATPSMNSEEIQEETTFEGEKNTHNPPSEELLTYFNPSMSERPTIKDAVTPTEPAPPAIPTLSPKLELTTPAVEQPTNLPPTPNPETNAAPPAPPTSGTVDPIDLFLARKPEISRPQSEFFNAEKAARKSLIPPDDLISETLAKIYVTQGHIQKAIDAYEKLSLKFPSKKLYFAATIEKLKDSTDL